MPGSQTRRVLSALLLTIYLPACHEWQVRDVAPAELVDHQHPAAIRVTRMDSSQVTVDQPRVAGDSIVGSSHDLRVAVAVADISRVAVRRTDALATAVLILSIAGVIIGVAAASANVGPDFSLGD